jgi:hypothetical protein
VLPSGAPGRTARTFTTSMHSLPLIMEVTISTSNAFSTKWPFLPAAAWPLLQGRATIYLLLSVTIFPALVWIDAGRRRA